MSFEQLKHLLSNFPILKITYACKDVLGGVCMQEGCVINCESNKLEHEKNYVTHNLKLVGILHTLEVSRHNFLRRKFILILDQSGIRCLFDQP